MVIPPILPTAILIGLNVSVLRLKASGIKTFQVNRVAVIGGCQVMCFDKTGTITEDGLSFSGIRPLVSEGLRESSRHEGARHACMRMGACVTCDIHSSSEDAALGMGVCHSLMLLEGRVQGNEVDTRMFEASGYKFASSSSSSSSAANNIHFTSSSGATATVFKRWDFDHKLQLMSVAVKTASGASYVYCKGSYERVRACVRQGGLPADYDESCANLARNGCYVLALARKQLPPGIGVEDVGGWDRAAVECDLGLVGVMTFDNFVKVGWVWGSGSVWDSFLFCIRISQPIPPPPFHRPTLVTCSSLSDRCVPLPYCYNRTLVLIWMVAGWH